MSDVSGDSGATGWIGQSVPRPDGPAKASGAAVYPQDRALPAGCLHAATVRASVACARVDAVDASLAAQVPGVVQVLTAADVSGTNRFGIVEPDQPVLVETRIHGTSDVVALVVATTARAAREGARQVGVSLTPLPPVLDAEHALDAEAPAVQVGRGANGRHANLLAERAVHRGNAVDAIRNADVIVEATYHTSWVEHCFLAPEAGLAVPDDDGGLTLYVSTQWPMHDLRQAAAALGEPLERLRIVQDTIGGAFGGREDVSLQILLMLAARATGSPVRMAWDRAEAVRGHGKRHPFRIRHRLAADTEGRFLGVEVDLLIDAGCYASTSSQLLDNAMAHLCGPYDIENVAVRARAVLTNNPFGTAFRGFGVNQVTFAMEQQVNKVAAALRMAPADVRRRNFVRGPGVLGLGTEIESEGGLGETLALATEAADRRPLPATGGLAYGRGVASAAKNIGYGFGFDDHVTAEVVLTRDQAVVCVGAAEVGQGAETVIAQIAATVLDLLPSQVRVEWRDTRVAPDAGSSSASRQTVASGHAVHGACEQVLREVAEAGGLSCFPEGSASARCTWRFPSTTSFDERPARHLAAFGWSTCIADVAVDRQTGEVRVLQVFNALDAGRVVNPMLLRGQVEGGVVMGQGYALQERFQVHNGMPDTVGFESCAVPTAMDATPHIETLLVEVPEAIGPFGARGIGEIAMIPVVPAITAAIHAACGVWIDELPASPDRVRAAIRALERSDS